MPNRTHVVPQGESSTKGIPFVASVPHTGTRFTKELLRTGYGPAKHVHFLKEETLLEQHLTNNEGRIVVPMRDPKLVLKSWHKRRRSIDQNWNRAWEKLMEIRKEHTLVFFPVDHPERDKYLQNLSNHFGMELTTEWVPVTELSPDGKPPYQSWRVQETLPVPELDLTWIYNFLLLEGINYNV